MRAIFPNVLNYQKSESVISTSLFARLEKIEVVSEFVTTGLVERDLRRTV